MKLKRNKQKKRQAGQVLVEFILVMLMLMTLLFMIVQISFGLAWGHYVQYATYMAARALYSGRATEVDQQSAAKDVLQKMVKSSSGSDKELFSIVAQARTGDARDVKGGSEPIPGAFIGAHPFAAAQGLNSRAYGWAEGVQYNFEVPLFLLPMASWITKSHNTTIQMGDADNTSPAFEWKGKLPFTSDSWLGREVSVGECAQDMEQLEQGIGRDDGNHFLYDNGC